MASNKGLGRGLGALLGDFGDEVQDSKSPYRTLPIYKVEPNPGQPRQDFDEEELQALAESISVLPSPNTGSLNTTHLSEDNFLCTNLNFV